MILPVTLCTAAAMAVLTIWLMVRIGKLRGQEKILHGDGGNPGLIRRMRAQLNFVESAPFVLALAAGIEITGKGGQWLAYVAGIYILGRVAHAIGMDAETAAKTRVAGVVITLLTLLGLAIVAVLIAAGVM
ncbi:MAPEG family protein [Pontixanthobacter aquaemixtae]|uniref:MAPEG family protein n=1 Tax=Pontixanthobacter aquaemixtae TaxID=1958940 RepID=A0A844ZTC5_9SPHN|nr:MAPEG family protein [Pontixanthobacter aquaemixtae]MXO90724.1 MAPEG family protein [Pontixanthobacter aquaemixtae]